MQNLGDVIKSLKEIERVSKKSYVVLASGENHDERNKFYKWTLIGTTILLKKEIVAYRAYAFSFFCKINLILFL